MRGAGDVGSAESAVFLFRAGYAVALPCVTSLLTALSARGAVCRFVDAIFDGECLLDGVTAHCIDQVGDLDLVLMERKVGVPVTTVPFQQVLGSRIWAVLVDAQQASPNVPSQKSSVVLRQ